MITRTQIQTIAQEMTHAMEAIAHKHHVRIRLTRSTYGDGPATAKFEIAEVGESGTVETRERADFKKYAAMYGFAPEDLDRTVEVRGTVFSIRGLRLKARLRPIVMQSTRDGKNYVFEAKPVAALLRVYNDPNNRAEAAR